MKTISDYTIYCTEEQTKIALVLGAPIKINSHPPINGEKFMWLSPSEDTIAWNNSTNCLIPTTEQMISWLEEQGFYFHINTIGCSIEIDFNCIYENHEIFRKESTLAAIDAALDYLVKIKEEKE